MFWSDEPGGTQGEAAARPMHIRLEPAGLGEYDWCMGETAISVDEAAKDFLRVLGTVEQSGQPAVLLRDGKPVATLAPSPRTAQTCGELAERWLKLDRLPPDEAAAFADDIQRARADLPPFKPAWD